MMESWMQLVEYKSRAGSRFTFLILSYSYNRNDQNKNYKKTLGYISICKAENNGFLIINYEIRKVLKQNCFSHNS